MALKEQSDLLLMDLNIFAMNVTSFCFCLILILIHSYHVNLVYPVIIFGFKTGCE